MRVPTTIFATGLALLMAVPAAAHMEKTGDLKVIHPWVEPAQAGATTKAHPTLQNKGDDKLRIVDASSEAADSIQLLKAGEPADAVTVPPGAVVPAEKVQFKLIDVEEPLKKGETVSVRLDFADRHSSSLDLAVGRNSMPSG